MLSTEQLILMKILILHKLCNLLFCKVSPIWVNTYARKHKKKKLTPKKQEQTHNKKKEKEKGQLPWRWWYNVACTTFLRQHNHCSPTPSFGRCHVILLREHYFLGQHNHCSPTISLPKLFEEHHLSPFLDEIH
jgi:hypothetical protein